MAMPALPWRSARRQRSARKDFARGVALLAALLVATAAAGSAHLHLKFGNAAAPEEPRPQVAPLSSKVEVVVEEVVLMGVALAVIPIFLVMLKRFRQKNCCMPAVQLIKNRTLLWQVVIPVLGSFFMWMLLMYRIQHGLLGDLVCQHTAMYGPIVATFIAGYTIIVLEEQTSVSKASSALVLGVSMWALVGTGLGQTEEVFDQEVKLTLEDVAEVVFFLLGALAIVEIMDAHKGFDNITKAITATRSRSLLAVIAVVSFFLSSVLNNLTVVIVMISLLQKIVEDRELRQRIGGIVVIASNAGGAWTPMGDMTTTMLYIGGQVKALNVVANLFFPSFLCLLGALGWEYFQMDGKQEFRRPVRKDEEEAPPNGSMLVFCCGLAGMVTVPIFTACTECPAWSGMMLVLGLLGVITGTLHGAEEEELSLKGALTRVEISDVLFFLGVLFAVGGLERIGLLKEFALTLGELVPSEKMVAVLLGFASAVVDNVPLVAAAQGMYDLRTHPANDQLWNFITYCSATGGSLLVIGSSAGVAFMGMEKGVSFGWYFRNVTPPALAGYFAGIVGLIILEALGLSMA